MWGVRPAGARLDPRRPPQVHSSQTKPSSPVLAGSYPTMGPGLCWGLQPWAHHPWVCVLSPPCSLASQPRPAQALSPELLAPREQPAREQGGGRPGLSRLPLLQPFCSPDDQGQVASPSIDRRPREPPVTPAPFKGWAPHKLPGPTQGDTESKRWSPALEVGWWKRQGVKFPGSPPSPPQASLPLPPAEGGCQGVLKREQK